MNFKSRFVALCAVLCFSPSAAFAIQDLRFPQPDGRFLFHVFEKDDICDAEDGGELVGAYNLTANDIDSYNQGMRFWDSVLGPGAKNTRPIQMELLTIGDADDNASAYSEIVDSGIFKGMTRLSAAVMGGENSGSVADLTVNRASDPRGWYAGPMSSLPKNGMQSDLSSTITHELFHALGVLSSASADENGVSRFGKTLSKWDEHLRDVNNNAPEAEMAIIERGYTCPDDSCFVTTERKSGEPAYKWGGGVYFTGDNVQEVLRGATIGRPSETGDAGTRVPGLPLNVWETGENGQPLAELAHIELRNSLQSHQDYRNWNTFMEAEIAVLQDLGYDIDRRNFYGYSVYNDGETMVNDNPYFARADGAFLSGVANKTPWGTGLHIYGERNNITQTADLLADGDFSVGVRVDGSQNALTVAPGTKITANGAYSYGILYAYGKEQKLDMQGSVEAAGTGGIGIAFDFGDNELGNNAEYRGSYIRTVGREEERRYLDLLPELEGALISKADISGTVKGGYAAVYIGKNAWVKEINFKNGAAVAGDIRSEWSTENPEVLTFDLTETVLHFGGDPAFNMTVDGGIYGLESFNMTLTEGSLTVNGEINVKKLTTDTETRLTLRVDNAAKSTAVVQASDGIFIDGAIGYAFDGGLMGLKQGDVLSVLTVGENGTLQIARTDDTYVIDSVFDWYRLEYDYGEDMLGLKVVSSESKTQDVKTVGIMTSSVVNSVGTKIVSRLNALGSMKGRSGGDMFAGAGVWGKALYTHARKSGEDGFSADAFGGVVGADSRPADGVTAGVALAYSRTNSDDADIDTYSAFVYGGYKQTDRLSYNAVLGYGLSRVDADKSSAFNAHFVNAQGYADYALGGGFTATGGMRWLFTRQGKYNIGATTFKQKDADTLTGVLGGRYDRASGRFSAQARLAAIYDFVSDKGSVKATNSGATLFMDGDRLRRFGTEAGVSVGYAARNWTFELGYDAQIRWNYNDQTVSLKADYRF
ncbi:MAG: autotransporter outer membrane beta-barrel domain-containing protein [Alphaproteobacteria bacterium]